MTSETKERREVPRESGDDGPVRDGAADASTEQVSTRQPRTAVRYVFVCDVAGPDDALSCSDEQVRQVLVDALDGLGDGRSVVTLRSSSTLAEASKEDVSTEQLAAPLTRRADDGDEWEETEGDEGILPTFMGKRWKMVDGGMWDRYGEDDWPIWQFSAQYGGKPIRA